VFYLKERAETVLVIALTLFLIGAPALWLYDCFYGAWLDVPVQDEPERPRPTTYQVMPGDNLWAIATKFYPGYHTGEVVGEIRKLNGLNDSATIYPYEVIKLPEVEL
jgi:nucleoid-associated protein YgaU